MTVAVASVTRLSRPEVARLSELETTIAQGLNTFVEVGSALASIRDSRLYRADYDTFEDYCGERWGMKRARAYQLIEAATAVENLSTNVDRPRNEAHVRPLTRLEPDDQREAWTRANEIATVEGTPVRARHVEQAVAERKPRPKKYDADQPIPADTLIASWRTECARLTDAVEETFASASSKTLLRVWNEAAQPMIRELQKLQPLHEGRK